MNLIERNWSSKTILIAEDVESNFLFLEEVIRKTGAEVLWAKNGEDAIEMFNCNKVDLILMDIQMPLMNGFEATKIIKKQNTKILIISKTAYAMSKDPVKTLNAYCNNYNFKVLCLWRICTNLSNEFTARRRFRSAEKSKCKGSGHKYKCTGKFIAENFQ